MFEFGVVQKKALDNELTVAGTVTKPDYNCWLKLRLKSDKKVFSFMVLIVFLRLSRTIVLPSWLVGSSTSSWFNITENNAQTKFPEQEMAM